MNNSTVAEVADVVEGGNSNGYSALKSYAHWYWMVHPYLSLGICMFGIPTNLVNIVILTRKKMLNPINCLLTGIAISDMVTMLDYIPFVIHFYLRTEIGNNPERYTRGWTTFMGVHACLTNITHTLSIWLAVSLSIIRYSFIRSRGTKILTIHQTCVMITLVFVTSVVVFIPNYLTTEIEPVYVAKHNTTVYRLKLRGVYYKSQNTSTLDAINTWLFISVGKFVPCVLICIFGGLLLHTLHETKRLTESLRGASCTIRMKQHKRTTKMLLAIILMFVVAELPSGILVFISVFVERFFQDYYELFADTLDIMSLINNSVNFIMYCSMSRQFRECLCENINARCASYSVTVTNKYQAVSYKAYVNGEANMEPDKT